MLSRNLFHTGYAVGDADKAIANLAATFGIRDWKIVRLPEDSPGKALAFAYAGEMMIELVDTRPGGVAIYDGWAPEGTSAIRLHHLGHFAHSREEFEAITRQFAEQGIAMAIDDEMPGLLWYRYFDTLALLGHYTEFVLMLPGGEAFWADVPRN
jgi:hypothetical protein